MNGFNKLSLVWYSRLTLAPGTNHEARAMVGTGLVRGSAYGIRTRDLRLERAVS